MRLRKVVYITVAGTFALQYASALAADWPMYRADAGRSGVSPDALPAGLELQWTYHSPAPRPAWPSSARITYDFAHQPILMGNTIVLGSTVDDSVVALDAGSGRVRWTFITGGPVRFAPAGRRDRVFVASDDGCLYALAIDDGRLLWKHRGGPDARLCLGNERMISRWPARGGPVVFEDMVYYAAGIWPSGGVYIYAVSAETGRTAWTNDRTGQLLMNQPHPGATARSGVAPQGYLVATADQVFIPTGRAVPAALRRSDGELKHYLLQENGSMGGARALIADRYVVNGGCFLEQETGKLAARAGRGVFSAGPAGVLQFTGTKLLAYHWDEVESRDRKGTNLHSRGLKKYAQLEMLPEGDAVRRAALASESLPSLKSLLRTDIVFKDADPAVAQQTGLERTLAQLRPDVERLGADITPFMASVYERSCEVISAGDEAVCGTSGSVSIVDLKANKVRWKREVEGDAVGLIACGGRLVVSTTAGMIYSFADGGAVRPGTNQLPSAIEPMPKYDLAARAAEEILQKSGVHEGFCLDIGCGDGRLALELVRRSRLQVIGIEADPVKVNCARRMLAAAGMNGSRVTIVDGKLEAGTFPRNFADLIVSSAQLVEPSSGAPDRKLIESLQRPDGGVICLGVPGRLDATRRGSMQGAGLWTHQNSDAANTLCSGDTVVRGPLELSWYNDGVPGLPDRHAQTPAPLFNRGVLVVEGVNVISGVDAYNGRTRWVHAIPGILSDWDGVHHDVGVGDCGGNFCLSDDAVFVRTGRSCLKLDLMTGTKLAEFVAPVDDAATNCNWGYVAYSDGMLFGTVLNELHTVSPRYQKIRLRTESVLLFAMDATTGKVMWQYRPERSLRNNSIAVAGGRLYLIDRQLAMADRILDAKPDGKHRPLLKPGEQEGGTLVALDASSGAVAWKSTDDIFGTQLAVSLREGLLLMYYQGVKHGFFKLPSEVGGRLAAFSTVSGKRAWDRMASYKTRPIINGEMIYAEGGAWNLKTGEEVPWKMERSYGCGQIAGGRYMLLFRSSTLGYFDLSGEAGTENFGGVRPSCWFSAIPAGGMVLVPDGSSQCACSYQMQAWLALQPVEVH